MNNELLATRIKTMRGDPGNPVQATILIPVNVQGDDSLSVLLTLADLAQYCGEHTFEIILVLNNYPEDDPPNALIEKITRLGIQVIAIPAVQFSGGVAIAARMPGVHEATSAWVIHLDADCRIPNPQALLDWYVDQGQSSASLAYTHVDYHSLPPDLSTRVRMIIHHSSRWVKRVLLQIPTSRGSNYAIRRELMIRLYGEGRIPYDIHVGPVVKSIGGKIAYSGDSDKIVYTSGRFFSGGWKELFQYLVWRVGYYWRILVKKRLSP